MTQGYPLTQLRCDAHDIYVVDYPKLKLRQKKSPLEAGDKIPFKRSNLSAE
ncbi:hypothetical protein BMS3Bbin04_00992 [bacterium BMS3Bbin04]|nr:hypothetical protein BMS3Bbin04_00992 [bacterium BMS3Bbin04]